MEARRARLGSVLEWILAAVCLVALLSSGSMLVRDFRTVSAVTPVIANEVPLPDPPAAVPSRSTSVPVLLFPDGSHVNVGDSAADVVSLLGSHAEVGSPSTDRIASGERVTRFYERGGVRFALVFAPSGGDGQITLAGIYVQ